MALCIAPPRALGAAGKKLVYVYDFTGPKAATVKTQVVALLNKKFAILPVETYTALAERLGLTPKDLRKKEEAVRVARTAGIDALVRGKIEKVGKKLVLRLRAYRIDGEEVWGEELALKGTRLGTSAIAVSKGLVPAIEKTEMVPADLPADDDDDDESPETVPETAPTPATLPVIPPDSGIPKKPVPGGLPAVLVARVGVPLSFRLHRGTSPDFDASIGDICDGFICFDVMSIPGFSIDVDLHPLAFLGTPAPASLGLGLRYTHAFMPKKYNGYDPTTDAFDTTELRVGLHAFDANLHLELRPAGMAPRVEPFIGFGLLDLPAGDNAFDLRSFRWLSLEFGLNLKQPVVADLFFLQAGASLRLSFDSGGNASEAYGETPFPVGTGFGAQGGIVIEPSKWVELGLRWRLSWTAGRFSGIGSSGLDDVRIVESIHTAELTIGVRIPVADKSGKAKKSTGAPAAAPAPTTPPSGAGAPGGS